MNFKELVTVVSNETGVPAAAVRKVGTAILEKFAEMIDKQDKFISPSITFQSVIVPAKEGGQDKAERKIARMQRRARKA